MEESIEEAMKRVLEVVEWSKMNPRSFCAYIDFGYSAFMNYVKGYRPASNYELYKKVLSTFVDISAEWLIRGEGPMLRSEIQGYTIGALLDKIDKQQEIIVSQSREIGKLEGKIEELEKRPVRYQKGEVILMAAEKEKKYKTVKKDE